MLRSEEELSAIQDCSGIGRLDDGLRGRGRSIAGVDAQPEHGRGRRPGRGARRTRPPRIGASERDGPPGPRVDPVRREGRADGRTGRAGSSRPGTHRRGNGGPGRRVPIAERSARSRRRVASAAGPPGAVGSTPGGRSGIEPPAARTAQGSACRRRRGSPCRGIGRGTRGPAGPSARPTASGSPSTRGSCCRGARFWPPSGAYRLPSAVYHQYFSSITETAGPRAGSARIASCTSLVQLRPISTSLPVSRSHSATVSSQNWTKSSGPVNSSPVTKITFGWSPEGVEALADVEPVQRPAHRVRHVVERVGHEDPLLAVVGGRLGEAGLLEAVGRPPGEVGPVGAGLEDVVLEVGLVEQDQPLAVAELGELRRAGRSTTG